MTFRNYPEQPSKETLAHLGLALGSLRRRIADHKLDESLLLAVLQLVLYEVFPPIHYRGWLVNFQRSTGSQSNWRVHFDAALSILIDLPFLQLQYYELTPLQLYFIRKCTFDDVIAATTISRSPILFLRHIHNLSIGLGVHNLFGCSDQILAVINQGAELEAWKTKKRSKGELSIGELYKNGTRILMQLWDGNGLADGFGPIIAEIYRCSTVIYLNVVMSGTVLFSSDFFITFVRSVFRN